jgi:uncharacterized protein YqkB
MSNVQSKSILAKLLATENITIRRNPNASTASFDVKNRVLEMPIWKGVSEDLEDMLAVHETGHALDTPADGWLDAIDSIAGKYHTKSSMRQKSAVKGFLNVIEDARIDKRQKRRYPGSRRNYLKGYQELITRGFFGPPDKDLNSYSFIDRLNLYFKGGAASGIKFSSDEMPFVKRVESAETFEDVLTLTDEIYGFCKSRGDLDQQTPQDLNTTDDNGDGFGESDDYDDLNDDSDESYDDGDSSDEDDESSDTQDMGSTDAEDADDVEDDGDDNSLQGEGDIESTSADKDATSDTSKGDAAGDPDEDDDFVPESETEKVWREKQSELSDTSTDYVYITIPRPILKNIVDDYKVFLEENEYYFKGNPYVYPSDTLKVLSDQFTQFKKAENNTISFMVKEFEMRKSADTYNKSSVSKTGVIDTNKLHSYKYNEDVFRRVSVVPQGKNHGFIMFLDWSGSMAQNIEATLKQLTSMVLFCKRVQIPFEVYIFRTPSGYGLESDMSSVTQFDYKSGDMKFYPFKIRNVLSSRMSISELNRAFNILWIMTKRCAQVDMMANTPLNSTIVCAAELVNQFRVRNQLQIVNTIFLTDGGSDPMQGVQDEIASAPNKTRKYVLSDEQTKEEYFLISGGGFTAATTVNTPSVTTSLFKSLKARTGCNLIGFYLYTAYARGGARADSVYREFFGVAQNTKHYTEMTKLWNESKFIPITTQGYDEYFIIDARSMRYNDTQLAIDSTMTKNKIAKSFLTFSSKKALNRVLLQRFITLVASAKAA